MHFFIYFNLEITKHSLNCKNENFQNRLLALFDLKLFNDDKVTNLNFLLFQNISLKKYNFVPIKRPVSMVTQTETQIETINEKEIEEIKPKSEFKMASGKTVIKNILKQLI